MKYKYQMLEIKQFYEKKNDICYITIFTFKLIRVANPGQN